MHLLENSRRVFAEITLPVSEIYQGHLNDSISQAQFSLYRYNAANQESAFEVPQTLLLVRKQDMYTFFEEGKVPDEKTSYVTSFNSSYNTYTFSNISNLVSYCKRGTRVCQSRHHTGGLGTAASGLEQSSTHSC